MKVGIIGAGTMGSGIAQAFAQTEAYSELFMELATDDKAAADFVNGIVPADAAKELAAQNAEHPALKK